MNRQQQLSDNGVNIELASDHSNPLAVGMVTLTHTVTSGDSVGSFQPDYESSIGSFQPDYESSRGGLPPDFETQRSIEEDYSQKGEEEEEQEQEDINRRNSDILGIPERERDALLLWYDYLMRENSPVNPAEQRLNAWAPKWCCVVIIALCLYAINYRILSACRPNCETVTKYPLVIIDSCRIYSHNLSSYNCSALLSNNTCVASCPKSNECGSLESDGNCCIESDICCHRNKKICKTCTKTKTYMCTKQRQKCSTDNKGRRSCSTETYVGSCTKQVKDTCCSTTCAVLGSKSFRKTFGNCYMQEVTFSLWNSTKKYVSKRYCKYPNLCIPFLKDDSEIHDLFVKELPIMCYRTEPETVASLDPIHFPEPKENPKPIWLDDTGTIIFFSIWLSLCMWGCCDKCLCNCCLLCCPRLVSSLCKPYYLRCCMQCYFCSRLMTNEEFQRRRYNTNDY